MKEISISKVQEGQRLDRFLGKCLPQASSGFLHKMLRKKNIKLNGQKADGPEKLKAGDVIQIYFSDETFDKFAAPGPGKAETGQKEKANTGKTSSSREAGRYVTLNQEQKALRRQVKVLYKDEDVVILHKPAGMLSQKSVKSDDSLNDYLLDLCRKEKWIDEEALRYFRPSIANRLDRNTSGIVLCGITTRGLQMISQTLRDRSISKYYMALVKGKMTGKQKIKGYLVKDHEKNVVNFSRTVSEDAAAIETEYEVIQTGKEVSLLRIRLITGKSHQIRAHLAAIGCPILGDYKYGDRAMNQRMKEVTGLSYQMLHSYEIDFGNHMSKRVIRDELPEDFKTALKLFGLEY